MKRNWKNKTIMSGLLTLSCIGILFTGCGTKDTKDDALNVGQEITEADLQTSSSAAVPDEHETNEGSADSPAKPVEDTAEAEASSSETPVTESETPTAAGSLYEQFLHGDLAAAIGKSYPQEDYRTPILEAGASYTLFEIGDHVSAYFLDPEITDKTSYDRIQYAYVDCPDNPGTEKKNLLVKFVGLNIYSPDDDSYAVFVISENDGQLYVTHEYECWARSAATAYKTGLLNDFGSAGAGDHYSGLSAILSDGSIASLFFLESLSGQWTSYIDEAIYNEVFGPDIVVNLEAGIYTIGEDRYYVYDMSYCTEEEIPFCETYIDRCRNESGINWVTEEEIDATIQSRCSLLGIDYGLTKSQEEVQWNNLQ